MRLYWKIDAQLSAGYILAVTAAVEHAGACRSLGVPPYSPLVAELTSPAILGAISAIPIGDVTCVTVDRLPSVYDQFGLGTGRMDYDAMEDAGFRTT